MKPVIRSMGFILSLLFLFSCHKTSDKPDTVPIKMLPKLSKTVIWSNVMPKRQLDIYEYHYDSLNRVTDITYYLGDSVNGKLESTYNRIQKFLYNGNDQKPYKSIGSVATDPQSELFYFFDSNGRLVTDSLLSANCNCYVTRKYQWLGDQQIMTTTTTVDKTTGTPTISKDSTVLRDGNLIWQYTLASTNLGIGSNYVSYDNYKNPFYAMNINMARGGAHTPGNSKNNIKTLSTGFYKASGTNSGTQTTLNTIEYDYNYNADSLPIDCNIHGPSAPPGKMNYYYKD